MGESQRNFSWAGSYAILPPHSEQLKVDGRPTGGNLESKGWKTHELISFLHMKFNDLQDVFCENKDNHILYLCNKNSIKYWNIRNWFKHRTLLEFTAYFFNKIGQDKSSTVCIIGVTKADSLTSSHMLCLRLEALLLIIIIVLRTKLPPYP